MQNTRQVVLPATKPRLSCLREGPEDHWCWVAGVPDHPDPEGGSCSSETPYLVLYPPPSHRIKTCLGRRQRPCHVLRPSVLWTGTLSTCSIGTLVLERQRVSAMGLRTTSPDSPPRIWTGRGIKHQSPQPSVTMSHTGNMQHTYLRPPSPSFCEPAECREPACKLMLVHKCLARAGFSCGAMFV